MTDAETADLADRDYYSDQLVRIFHQRLAQIRHPNLSAYFDEIFPEYSAIPVRHEPDFIDLDRQHFHLEELLRYYDSDFVEACYLAILKRPPEEAAKQEALKQLRARHYSRIEFLIMLCDSDEGRANGVEVAGLSYRRRLYGLLGKPLLGNFASLLLGLDGLAQFDRELARANSTAAQTDERLYAIESGFHEYALSLQGSDIVAQGPYSNFLRTLAGAATPDDPQTLPNVLSLYGQQFVHAAYRLVLQRGPDPSELQDSLIRLASGDCSRAQLLEELCELSGAAVKTADIPGLKLMRRRERRERIPILGFFLRFNRNMRELGRVHHFLDYNFGVINQCDRRLAAVGNDIQTHYDASLTLWKREFEAAIERDKA